MEGLWIGDSRQGPLTSPCSFVRAFDRTTVPRTRRRCCLPCSGCRLIGDAHSDCLMLSRTPGAVPRIGTCSKSLKRTCPAQGPGGVPSDQKVQRHLLPSARSTFVTERPSLSLHAVGIESTWSPVATRSCSRASARTTFACLTRWVDHRLRERTSMQWSLNARLFESSISRSTA